MGDRFLILVSKVIPNGCTTEGCCKAVILRANVLQ